MTTPKGGAWDVVDEKPMRSTLQQVGDFMRDQAGWQATRAVNAATGVLGNSSVVVAVRNAADAVLPPGAAGVVKDLYPDAQLMRDAIFARTKPVNTPEYLGGKYTDAAVEAGISMPAFPGAGVRGIIPGGLAGGASEAAGNIPGVKGTKWEPAARFGVGALAGLTGAGLQEGARAGGQMLRNAVGAVEPKSTATSILARDLERDRMTPEQLATSRTGMGDDAFLVDAGGANTRGALRGAVALRGQARDMAQEAFDQRASREGTALNAATDRALSPRTLTQTVDEVVADRSKAAGPAYEKAGVPQDPANYAAAPVLQGPAIKQLVADSADIQEAIKAARRLPAYKDLPETSMVMLDEAYKRIGDKAIMSRGNLGEATHLSRQYDGLRETLGKAIDTENPAYGEALRAWSEPSKLKDAALLGQRLFSSNARPDAVKAAYDKLPDVEKEMFRVGAAETLRKSLGGSNATNKAGRMVRGDDGVERLRAVLSPAEFDDIMGTVQNWRAFAQTARDVNAGSRTAPMLADAADNAAASAAGGAARDALGGNYLGALMRVGRAGIDRVAQGRTEGVNNELARLLLSPPEEQATVIGALNDAMLRNRTGRAGVGNAFRAGLLAPASNALPNLGR